MLQIETFLTYDPIMGVFTWIKSPTKSVKIGDQAGYKRKDGYIIVGFKGKTYLAHRLAWLLTKGEFPKQFIDHIDGDPTNNSWANLREATNQENTRNRRVKKGSTSNYLGVSWSKVSKKWLTHARFLGKVKYLGLYHKEEEAAKAYDEFAKKFYGEFANLNFKDSNGAI